MDADPQQSGELHCPDGSIRSVPSWAGKGTIVAVIGAADGDRIALIDVSSPAHPRVKQVLWRKADGPGIKPVDPIYSAVGRRCVFVGARAEGMSLYSVQEGRRGPAKRLGKGPDRKMIVNLEYSPDGRYVLYSVHGPA